MTTCTLLPNFVNLSNATTLNLFLTRDDSLDFPSGSYFLRWTSLVAGSPPPSFQTAEVLLTQAASEITFSNVQFNTSEVGVYAVSIVHDGNTQEFVINSNRDFFEIYQEQGQLLLLENYLYVDPAIVSFSVSVYILGITSFFQQNFNYVLTLSDGINTYVSDPVSTTSATTYILQFTFQLSGGPLQAGAAYVGTLNTSPTTSTVNSLQIALSCYVEGTKIRLADGLYKPIQDLCEGDLLDVYRTGPMPIKKICKSFISNSEGNHPLYRLYRYRKEVFPDLFEDLIVTGGHSILVDSLDAQEYCETVAKYWPEPLAIEDKELLLTVVNKRVEHYNDQAGPLAVYQIVLESANLERQYGIYANGILSETMSVQFYKDNYLIQKSLLSSL